VKEEGYADFETVRSEIEVAVLKQKKGEALKEQLEEKKNNASSLDQIASAENLNVKEASQVQFANAFIPGIGLEPFIVGTAMHLPLETIAGPYAGENNVFLLNVTNRDENAGNTSLQATTNRLNNMIQSRTERSAYNALLEEADIEDNRLKVLYGR